MFVLHLSIVFLCNKIVEKNGRLSNTRRIASAKFAWSGATFYGMYLPGHDLSTTLLQPLAPFNNYDQWISLLITIIAGFSIVGLVRLYEGRAQPIKGILNIVTGIIIGIILWLALMPIIGTAPHVFMYHLGTTTAPSPLPAVDLVVPLIMPMRSPANVRTLLLCIMPAIPILQYTFLVLVRR